MSLQKMSSHIGIYNQVSKLVIQSHRKIAQNSQKMQEFPMIILEDYSRMIKLHRYIVPQYKDILATSE